MIFIEQKIEGVFLIKPKLFKDDRGIFRRHFCETEFLKKKITSKIRQANVSINYKKGTLRGFHYQTKPYEEDKTMSCLKGEIFDIIVDLRKKSKTYLKWMSFRLSEKNKFAIHIPRGCANSFLTLKDNTIVHYYCSQNYNPKYEGGINFDDPKFKFKWPIKPKIVSKKDRNIPFFKQDT
jgi:dTDP-4-dehydrorhamnose 3,5-epimerase